MISDEAVEAAAKSFPGYTPEDEADDLEREINAACRTTSRRILEAAAPHMPASEDAIRGAMADGWDECEQARYVISLNPTGTAWEGIKTNPYRSQA